MFLKKNSMTHVDHTHDDKVQVYAKTFANSDFQNTRINRCFAECA